jgi:integrase
MQTVMTRNELRQPGSGGSLKPLSRSSRKCRHVRSKGSARRVPSHLHMQCAARTVTVYSLRHSFKDRLIAAEAPDSLIDNLMGHKTYKPKYGLGHGLDLKLKYLQRIAFRPPASL